MSIEIKVPVLPESVADATVATWHKKVGEFVKRDEPLVDIETDKVVLEVVAPEDGMLESIVKSTGTTVKAQELIGQFKGGQHAPTPPPAKTAAPITGEARLAPTLPPVVAPPTPVVAPTLSGGPAARRKMAETGVAPVSVGERSEKRVPMSRLRAKIAERLLQSQQTAAILTTFNEINMKPVMDLRAKYKDLFEKKHQVKLGFMSFFARAVSEALNRFPVVNASIDGTDIVYHGYVDLSVAVSTERGLVVPVVRNVENKSLADIEKAIGELAQKAKTNTLTFEDMKGGTFTISNGGVFGTLMSTPIINPPQTGILGMHKIEDRPVVENGQIVIRPMMYVALSYDHRLIDGGDAARFLVTIKECLEDPTRLLLEV
jgi:2-oxoglutarate dehydrogenase E2 component (dihydrolipoamide succinyltransferase)